VVVHLNERIKYLRKEIFKMSQDEFGNRIGISRSNVANIEIGRINITDRVLSDISSEFNVNEHWLRTGEGDMFLTLPPEDEYIKAAAEISKDPDDEIIRQIIIEYWKLNPEGKKHLKEFIHNIIQNINKEE
jgi:transcriptional regulator with XRE-family HTH domain